MGTIRNNNPANIGTLAAGESTMGSDFDANNRTMESQVHGRTAMRQELDPNLAGKFPTEYDKKWVDPQQQKDYLQDKNNMTIDFSGGDQELPSSA